MLYKKLQNKKLFNIIHIFLIISYHIVKGDVYMGGFCNQCCITKCCSNYGYGNSRYCCRSYYRSGYGYCCRTVNKCYYGPNVCNCNGILPRFPRLF